MNFAIERDADGALLGAAGLEVDAPNARAKLGFWIGREGYPALGAYIVLSTVFLMGMHSAFFVPAKYGAMPEILTPRMLSKGNGVLESLSFMAVILGTVAGGALSTKYRGEEYVIGLILTGLALVGAESHVFVRQIALLVDDYDRRHGVQAERLVDRLIGVAQRSNFQIMLLRECLQIGVRCVIARAWLRAVDAHPVNLHPAGRITIGELLQRGQLFRRQRNPIPAERHYHDPAFLIGQLDLASV